MADRDLLPRAMSRQDESDRLPGVSAASPAGVQALDIPEGAPATRARHRRTLVLAMFLAAVGPGLMVMLADTDAGSVVTAAQSGASWGYSLLPLEVALIPVLYLVMELTVRLGIATGKGHAELVKDCFGQKWAVLSVALLVVSTTGALVTELAGLAGVGLMEGIPPRVTVPAAAIFLALVVMSGSYRRVERIGLGLGLFELAFLFAALRAHPSLHAAAASFGSLGPLSHGGYLGLVAANVGAVIMPWMIFYQQAAVVDKGLRRENLRAGRVDTAVGAVHHPGRDDRRTGGDGRHAAQPQPRPRGQVGRSGRENGRVVDQRPGHFRRARCPTSAPPPASSPSAWAWPVRPWSPPSS